MSPSRFLAVFLLSGVIVGLGGADFWVKERPRLQERLQEEALAGEPAQPVAQEIPTVEPGLETLPPTPSVAGQSSSRRAVKKGQSTKKKEAASVDFVFATLGLEAQTTRQVSLLQLTSPKNMTVSTSVLLKDGDRAMLFAWLDNPEAKTVFATLKDSLQATFSSQVSDLVDQTLTPENGAVTDILSFTDPALSSEKIIFARTRTRVYEIHVARGYDELVTRFIAELAK